MWDIQILNIMVNCNLYTYNCTVKMFYNDSIVICYIQYKNMLTSNKSGTSDIDTAERGNGSAVSDVTEVTGGY